MAGDSENSMNHFLKHFNNAPGCLLIILKILFNHWDGVMIAGAFALLFHYANSNFINSSLEKFTIKKQIEIIWVLLSLLSSIIALYYVYLPDHLYRSLFMMLTSFPTHNIWHLIWIVMITDFVLKFICIIIKCVISLIPSYQKDLWHKGSTYLVIEYLFQIYRMIAPMTPYVLFLTSVDPLLDSHWFNAVLVILYIVIKAYYLYEKISEFINDIKHIDLRLDMCRPYNGIDEFCSICHNKFNEPLILPCGDVFCKNCLIRSIMRYSLCPLCDNVVYFKKIQWRNGQTQAFMQLY